MAVEIPGYKITKTLGKGGMATVYLAIQDIFEREVALKVMSSSLNEDPSFGQRFMREAQIVSQLIHPNIVTVYNVALHENCYYLSMEYIDGHDLKHSRKHLSFLEKIQAVKDIASALDVSGAKGYVHRDIKPENIMIEAATKRAVLMDFGIARASEADISVTQAGTAIGTPHYMSPEQAKGLDVDPRADLYSLGVVLFYLIAGYVPFEGDSAVAIGIRHITEAIPELPVHLRDMQWIIDKSMAKDPNDRFQNGAELIASLDSLDLNQLANNIENQGLAEADADFDTPTVVNEEPAHHYGDSSHTDEPEDFTLSFKSIQTPEHEPKWPMYFATACVSLIIIIGGYFLINHETTDTANIPTAKSTQSSITNVQHQQVSSAKIIHIRASGTPKPDLTRAQPRTIAVADKLFFRFEYQDFNPTQIAIDIKLFDNSTNKALGIKPVVIVGPTGNNEVVFDLSRTGIKAGNYRVEIVMSGRVLGLLNFKVG